MQVIKLSTLTIIALVLASLYLVNITCAEDGNESIVDAYFSIEFKSATDLEISVTLDVSEIVIFGTIYDNEGILELSQNTTNDAIENMGALKLRLRQLLESQIGSSFEGADFSFLYEKPVYEEGLFIERQIVNLTPAFFKINEEIDVHNLVNGVLDMGARVNYTFKFNAVAGWNNIYEFKKPDDMRWLSSNEVISENKVRWTVANREGLKPEKEGFLIVEMWNPTTPRLNKEDINLEFELDSRTGEENILRTNILTKNIDMSGYVILPDFITDLDFVPSDGIRLFIDNDLLSWDDFYDKTIESIEDGIVPRLEYSLSNQTLDFLFSWDSNTTTECISPYEIAHMDNSTPIRAILIDDDVNLRICNISTRALFGLINSGAEVNISAIDVNFGKGFDEIDYEYEIFLYLPDSISLDGENVYKWNREKTIAGTFKSDVTNSFSENEIDVIIEIQINSADLNLLSFFTGKTELNFGSFLQESREYSVTTLPEDFSLPEKILINYLNADVIRLCIEEDVFDGKNVNAFLNNTEKLFENRLKAVLINEDLEINGHVNRDVFDASLLWDGDIAHMDNADPVKVVSYAYSSYPISSSLSFLPPGFNINNQNFSFKGIQNENVKYKVVFPHEIKIEIIDSDRAVVRETEDGRQYIEIAFDSSEFGLAEIVTCKIIPSPLFVVGIFMPCILSFVITLILVIIIYMIRKRRKGRKIVTSKEEDFGKYEEEKYYVPPPPRS